MSLAEEASPVDQNATPRTKLQEALEFFRIHKDELDEHGNKRWSQRKIAQEFSVAPTTLRDHINGVTSDRGRPKKVTKELENYTVQLCATARASGNTVSPAEITAVLNECLAGVDDSVSPRTVSRWISASDRLITVRPRAIEHTHNESITKKDIPLMFERLEQVWFIC